MYKIILKSILSLIVGLTLTNMIHAQSQVNASDLRGKVLDENGAIVIGAKLVLRNPKTGYIRETMSQEDGVYQFLAVPSGDYEVTSESEGFAKFVSHSVSLTVGQVAEMKITMKVGSVTDEVINVDGAQLIETSRTSVAETINQKAINNLPSNGRSYVNFTLLTSATTRDNQPVLGPAPTSGLNFGGQRARANNVSIDGADANDNATNGVRATVSQEAVQEFQIQTNSYAAEFGRASSAVINIVTKGGTNDIHGNAFTFLKDQSFSADNPFAGEKNYPSTRFQGGFTLGGPIQKDRTFYFLSFETTRRNETGFSQIGRTSAFGLISTAPGALASLVGNIPALLTPAQVEFVNNSTISLSTRASYFGLAREASNVALTGHTIAGSAIFPLKGNSLPSTFVPLNSLIGNYSQFEKTYFPSLRIDHRHGNHNLFARLSLTPSDVGGTPSNGQNQPTGLNAFSRTGFTGVRDFSIVAQDVTTVGSNLINEARFQFARRGLNYGPNGSGVGVEIPGIASFGREPFSPVFRTEKRTQLTDNVTISKDSHVIKFGFDYNFVQTKALFEVNFGGVYYFSNTLANNPILASLNFPSTAPPFSTAQSYGLGLPELFYQSFGNPRSNFNNPSIGLYVQDSWKIKPNFTFNYGIRYDTEFTKRFKPLTELSANAEDFLGVQQGLPRDYNNFAPRVAISWDPLKDGKTVIKAAYGLFYGHPLLGAVFLSDVNDGTQAPFLAVPGLLGAANLFQGTTLTPGPGPDTVGYLQGQQKFDPFNPALGKQENLLKISPVLPQTLHISRRFQYDYTTQANLSIERQITRDMGVGVTYSFIKGSKLLRPRNINPANRNLVLAYKRALAGDQTSPLYDLARALGPGAPAGELIFNGFRATGPNFAFAEALGLPEVTVRSLATAFGLPQIPGKFIPFYDVINYESSGSSVYNALTLNLNKRFSNNFQFLASYTWSHAIDDSTDIQTLQQPQDSLNPAGDRSNSNFDQRHRFVFNAVMQSPFKHSKAGVLNYLLGDWTLAPIIEISSGRPFNIFTNIDRSLGNSSNVARPDLVPLGTSGSFISPDGRDGLALPALGNVGNLGRNVYRSPGYASVDFRLARKFYLRENENSNLEFIFEMFNAFNRTNISEVLVYFERAGKSANAFPARQMQFALKYNF